MKILYYNWLPFDNAKNEGGGVNVYQRNLIEEMLKSPDNEICFISSGWKHNPLKSSAYIKKTKNVFGEKVKSFEIINSPVMAPAYIIYNKIDVFLDDMVGLKLFMQFVEQHGPFDVIHLNNIEGLSNNILKIKESCPNTRIVLSLHNYVMICPMVNLFHPHGERVCYDFDNGRECAKCATCRTGHREYIHAVRRYLADKINIKIIVNLLSYLFKFRSKKYVSPVMLSSDHDFARYRGKNVGLVNKYVDCALAVSERVREIAIKHGINEKIIKTSYIGTKFAESALSRSVIGPDNMPFTICYLGYARIDKGFWFLINALSKLPPGISSNIKVKLAVANIDKDKEYIKNTLSNFCDVVYIDGYSHSDLPTILSDVHLGVVPVLWEDNLPQVAIEMVAHGVPILCSDFGGASELCRSENFKFNGGNEQEFLEKLTNIVKQPTLLENYWESHTGLVSMKRHVEELMSIYNTYPRIPNP